MLTLLAGILTAGAAETNVPPIVAHIIEADTATVIQLPDGLDERLQFIEPVKGPNGPVKPRNGMAGYRIQVFSDGNVRTAKNGARTREMTVASRFPQYRTYKIYSAPYWRVHVGDFKTQTEANEAAARLRSAFPFASEIRVVRSRINVVD